MSWFFHPLEPQCFDVICIDVPWRWKNYSKMHNCRSPEAKYDTMALDEVARLPVRDLLAPGGFALCWFTWPLAAPALWIIQNEWGLDIRTGGAWGKRTKNGHLRMGTGFIMRGACEPFVIACNGKLGGLRGRSQRNFIESFEDAEVHGLAREHSRKPDVVYQAIEKMTPGWRRGDIFSRERRDGWTPWGHQVDLFEGPVKGQESRNVGRKHDASQGNRRVAEHLQRIKDR